MDALAKFDPNWFSSRLDKTVVDIEWGDVASQGMVSNVKKLRLTLQTGEKLDLILKFLIQQPSNRIDQKTVITLGFAREANFHNTISIMPLKIKTALNVFLPKVYYAESDWESGEKAMLMEDLSIDGIDSGLYFGPGSPLNWGKDLAALTSRFPNEDPAVIAEESFKCAARLHAPFWGTSDFSDASWLRGWEWTRGRGAGKEEWEARIKGPQDDFQEMEKRRKDGNLPVSDDLWDCLQLFYGNLKWENFQKATEEETLPITFVHGDFHPGNIMWLPNDPKCRVRFLDWEVVGLDYGPQELGQYAISHVNMSEYGADVQKQWVEAYYNELVTINPGIIDTCSFDACFSNYVNGGMRKWLIMLTKIYTIDEKIFKFFADQVETFRKLHDVRPLNVCYPST